MDIKRIKDLLQMNEKKIHTYAKSTLKRYYKKVVATKDYIFAVGEQPVCLVAHLDTVLKQPPKRVFYDPVEQVLFGNYGLGADDRAGAAAIIELLENGGRPSVLFTFGEETGGLGAYAFVEQYRKCPFNVNYFIEIDRRGRDNFVTYDCDNLEFDRYIKSFGWKKQTGTFSDIDIICPAYEIAGCNIAAGYDNEHTLAEILHLDWLDKIINRVGRMIADSPYTRHYSYIPAAIGSGTANSCECAVCSRWQKMEDIFYVRCGEKEANVYLPMCKDCLIELNVQYCPQCKELYWTANGEKLCDKCKEGLNARD